MAETRAKSEEVLKINERTLKVPDFVTWAYTYRIARWLIGGYLGLVVILLGAIIGTPDVKTDAINALETITTVFGPWIGALVAFYFAQKQTEKVSEQLSEAQKAITATVKPDIKKILKGILVKDIMEKFNPDKHEFPRDLHSEVPINESVRNTIRAHLENPERKDVRCFVVFKAKEKEQEIEGILTRGDIAKIMDPKVSDNKTIGYFTTDMPRIVKAKPYQSLSEILSSLENFDLLPVYEGGKIVGFVYRGDVFRHMSSVS
ncbi:MAG TPA: CBS domain-containing protein [Candidatus Brocadiia bacterium]|nr:CBS domain-containing protein [Candidatus Brocadiales bacterium]